MPIQVVCACGKKFSVKDELAGRKAKCPACRKPLLVPASEDFADESDELHQKARGGGELAPLSQGAKSGKKSGKKSSSSNRGPLVGLVAGGGLLVFALLAWMLWPPQPVVVAKVPAGNVTSNPATDAAGTASTFPTDPKPKDDLQWLQGTWKASKVELPPSFPRAAVAKSVMQQMTWTIREDILTMTTPEGDTVSTTKIKLDPTQTPKTIDMTPLEGTSPGVASLGLYSIDGETWRWCTAGDRPKLIASDEGPLLTLYRVSPRAVAPASLFNFEAWQDAEGKLKAMKVLAQLAPVAGERGFPEGLTHVVLFDPPVTADGTMSPEVWAIASSLSHVQARLGFTTDATLKQLSEHHGLLGINISRKSTITAKGIASLKTCPTLRSLYFNGVSVSPELLGAVAQLTELQSLGIRSVPLTSDMLGSITQMNHLESLSLHNTGITDEDTVRIAKLTNLKTLILDSPQVTDAGLQNLKELINLTQFDVRGLSLSPQALADFETAVPKCQLLK